MQLVYGVFAHMWWSVRFMWILVSKLQDPCNAYCLDRYLKKKKAEHQFLIDSLSRLERSPPYRRGAECLVSSGVQMTHLIRLVESLR